MALRTAASMADAQRVSLHYVPRNMRVFFHHPTNAEQPLHGVHYYLLLGACPLVLGLLYVLWIALSQGC